MKRKVSDENADLGSIASSAVRQETTPSVAAAHHSTNMGPSSRPRQTVVSFQNQADAQMLKGIKASNSAESDPPHLLFGAGAPSKNAQ